MTQLLLNTKFKKNALEQPFRILMIGVNADEWLLQVRSGELHVDVNSLIKLIDLKAD